MKGRVLSLDDEVSHFGSGCLTLTLRRFFTGRSGSKSKRADWLTESVGLSEVKSSPNMACGLRAWGSNPELENLDRLCFNALGLIYYCWIVPRGR